MAETAMIEDLNLLRLGVGLILICFHKPVADYIFAQERWLVDVLATRGWNVPTFPSEQAARDLYFCLGAFVCIVALLRMWVGA
jgi:hypothetical protein